MPTLSYRSRSGFIGSDVNDNMVRTKTVQRFLFFQDNMTELLTYFMSNNFLLIRFLRKIFVTAS